MANVLKLGNVLKLKELSADPISGSNGEMYYNTTSHKIRQYLNGTWQDVTAGSISLTGQVLNDGEIIVGNGSNLSAAVDTDLVGDIEADSTNGLTIKAGVIIDSDINASAAITRSKLATDTVNTLATNDASGNLSSLGLTSGQIVVGNGSNVPAAVSVSGDATISSSGDLQIAAGAIVNADINASAAIEVSKLEALTGSRVVVTDVGGVIDVASYAPGDVLLRDGSVALTGDLDANGNQIEGLGTPTLSSHAATKSYVDSVAEGLKPKAAVRVATTAALNLATDLENGDSVDGVTLVTGDRVLVKDQTAPAENGIYVVQASGAAVRATDFDALTPVDEINGAYVPVQQGTVNSGKFFVQSGTVAAIGTDPINFAFFNSAATLSGGDGIDITSNVISVDHDGEGLAFSAGQLALELDGGTLSKSATGVKVADGGISNTQVNASAAIDLNKLAAVTADRALQSDSSGVISASSVTSTELGYVSGVTSAIQTQLDDKANNTLNNLASVAINTSLISDTNNTDDLGSDTIEWKDAWVHRIAHGDGSNPDLVVETTSDNGNLVQKAHGTGSIDQQASKRRLSQSATSSNFMEEAYIDAITLSNNQTNAVISDLTVAHAAFEGLVIEYKIKEAVTNAVQIGELRIVTNGTDISFTETLNNTADLGITFDAVISGTDINVRYTSTNTGNDRNMRVFVKRIRA